MLILSLFDVLYMKCKTYFIYCKSQIWNKLFLLYNREQHTILETYFLGYKIPYYIEKFILNTNKS